MQKDFHQEDGHSSDLDRKRSGIPLILTDHKENGTESLNWWWSNLQKADTQLSVLRVHCLEERPKAKVVEICQYTLALTRERLKLFFAPLILLISPVFTDHTQICEEYKACQVRTVRLVLAGQSDPLFVPKNSFMKTPTPSTDDPAQEDLLRRYQERVERLSQQDRVSKFCSDARFLTTVEVGQHSWQKTLKNSHNSQMQWLVVSTLCQEMKNHLTRKVGFEGTPKLGPYWKLRPATCKVNMEVESELDL